MNWSGIGTGVQRSDGTFAGSQGVKPVSSQTQHLGQNQIPGFTQPGATPPKTGKTSTGKQIWYGAPMQVGDYLSLMQQNAAVANGQMQGQQQGTLAGPTLGVTANPFGSVPGNDVAADWARRGVATGGINSWADYVAAQARRGLLGNMIF